MNERPPDMEGVTVWGPSPGPQAAPVSFAEVFRLVQTLRYGGIIVCQNVFHFGHTTGGASSNSLVVDWRDNIVPTWKTILGGAMTFTDAYAQRILPDQDAIASVTLSGGGTLGGAIAPVIAAGILTWRTQLTGRRRRGRTYLAGLAYAVSGEFGNGYTWGATNVTRMTTLGNAILTRYTLGGNPYGFQLIVWSRAEWVSVPPESWGQAASMVTRFTVQPYIASMGSRRYGRGL